MADVYINNSLHQHNMHTSRLRSSHKSKLI